MQKIIPKREEYLAQYRNVRVAVLGASGFIGAWTARVLSRVGADLHLLVRNTITAHSSFKNSQINGQIIEVELTDLDRLGELMHELSPAITFNLAGYGVDRSERDAEFSRLINTELPGSLAKILKSDKSWHGQTLVHAGSALEYGTAAGDLSEDGPAVPTTLYGQTKLAGTIAVQSNACLRDLRAVTARLFTVYGPGEHEGRLLPMLIEAAATKKSVPLTAGTQLRDFTYVEDVAEGLLRLGISDAHSGQVVNVATGRSRSVRQFVETAADVLGIPQSHLHFGEIPTRQEEMNHKPVAIDRLRELTSWAPATDIAEGVRRTQQFEAVPIINDLDA